MKRERALIPRSSLMSANRPGIPDGEGVAALESGSDIGDDEVVATRGPSPRSFTSRQPMPTDQPSKLPLLLENRPDLGMAPNDDGIQLRIRGETKQQLWIAADTRESDVAVYLDSWRRKIERVGTMNFPSAARRRQFSGTPVIEVTIGADGRLLQSPDPPLAAVTPRSTKRRMRILKLASPYDPFPPELAAKHDRDPHRLRVAVPGWCGARLERLLCGSRRAAAGVPPVRERDASGWIAVDLRGRQSGGCQARRAYERLGLPDEPAADRHARRWAIPISRKPSR